MDPRGHQRPDSGHKSQRPRDREDRSAHQGGVHYPPPDPRERERQWSHPDHRYSTYLTSPPPRPVFTPNSYSNPQSRNVYGYDRQEHPPSRPHSRHGYDYPPHSYWDYRQDHGYYDHGYYGGHYGHPDASQRIQPRYEQEHSGNAYSEHYRYNQQSDSSQHDFTGPGEDHARENSEAGREDSHYDPGTLASSKTSGLSSSSYELSQYMNGAEKSDPALPQPIWSTSDTEHTGMSQATAPLKHSVPHALVSFGPAGQLIRVSPGLAMQRDPGLVEIHSLEIILGETQDQQEMRDFPGPLAREDLHKVDAICFALQRAEDCMRDEKLQDRGSAALLWNLLVLLCRQNGRIVGSDIAELLMRNSQASGRCDSDAPTLIDLSEGPTPEADTLDGADLLTGHLSAESTKQALQSYTKLLLAGRKKEALESAMKSGLWGHALFLASKMDNRSYTTVLNRFTSQLEASDPLQTVFQLLSGRTPAVATCCSSDRWGDWKPHLAIMLSNETGDTSMHQNSIITMGDTLASRGLLHAAHICYLTAFAPFGVYSARADRLVLLASSHSLPFLQFAQNSAIQCTELFEYCQSLGDKFFFIPSFQVYKFLYACRLLDCGLASQAFHYCEVVGMALLRQKMPCTVLLGEVVKLAERLRQSEGQLSGTGADRPDLEPEWLQQLRCRHRNIQMGSYDRSDTYQSPAEGSALAPKEHRVYSESDTDDHSSSSVVTGDVQSSDAQVCFYRGAEEEQDTVHQVNAPLPMPAYSQPAEPLVSGGQEYNCNYIENALTLTAPLYPALDDPPSSEGAEPSYGAGMMVLQVNAAMPVVEYGQGGHREQTVPLEGKASEPAKIQPKQSTTSGWFSGWFTSKPKDAQSEAYQDANPAQTIRVQQTESPPSSMFSNSPPPTTMGYPPMLLSQPSSAGNNPFSRKASKQLG